MVDRTRGVPRRQIALVGFVMAVSALALVPSTAASAPVDSQTSGDLTVSVTATGNLVNAQLVNVAIVAAPGLGLIEAHADQCFAPVHTVAEFAPDYLGGVCSGGTLANGASSRSDREYTGAPTSAWLGSRVGVGTTPPVGAGTPRTFACGPSDPCHLSVWARTTTGSPQFFDFPLTFRPESTPPPTPPTTAPDSPSPQSLTLGTINVTVDPTVGLTDGRAVNVSVTSTGGTLESVAVNQCADVVFDIGAFGRDGRCSRSPLSAASSWALVRGPYLLTQTTDGFEYHVGTGSQEITPLYGERLTLSCGPGAPCNLAVYVETTWERQFFNFPLTFRDPPPTTTTTTTTIGTTPTTPTTRPSPLCSVRDQIPRWIWLLLVRLLGVTCRP